MALAPSLATAKLPLTGLSWRATQSGADEASAPMTQRPWRLLPTSRAASGRSPGAMQKQRILGALVDELIDRRVSARAGPACAGRASQGRARRGAGPRRSAAEPPDPVRLNSAAQRTSGGKRGRHAGRQAEQGRRGPARIVVRMRGASRTTGLFVPKPSRDGTASAVACLHWGILSVSVRWRPPLPVAIVTEFVTRWLPSWS